MGSRLPSFNGFLLPIAEVRLCFPRTRMVPLLALCRRVFFFSFWSAFLIMTIRFHDFFTQHCPSFSEGRLVFPMEDNIFIAFLPSQHVLNAFIAKHRTNIKNDIFSVPSD